MNCLDLRRALTAEPASRTPEVLEHRAGCPSCDAFAVAQERLQERLVKAASLPAPAGLAQRILLRQRMERARLRHRVIGSVALAAALLVAVGLRWGAPSTEAATADHVREEWAHAQEVDPIPDAVVEAALREVSVTMVPGVDPVVYAGTCGLLDSTVAHLVLRTPEGPVTLLIMPETTVSRRRAFVEGELRGVLLRLGEGGLAVIASSPEAVARGEDLARGAIHPVPG